jgi:DNA repair protein RadC
MNHSYDMSTLKVLLAETLREKSTSYVIEELFNRFPTINELMDCTEQELLEIKGIGTAKSRQILSVLMLARSLSMPKQSPYVVRSPQDAFKLLLPELAYLQKEHFVCLFLNTKNHVIAKETLSIGSLNASIVHPREVFRAAIKRSSASIVCAHNHPSGDPTPSPEDIQITKRLVDVGTLIGIDVLDHLVIGHDCFYSLKEHGHM